MHVQDLETTLRRQVLDKHSHAIRNAQTTAAAVDSCVRLRKVAVEAPDTYAWVTPEIAAALKDLASTRAFQRDGMLMVEQQLQMMADVGQSIVAENPEIFGAVKEALNNEAFRKFGTTGDIGTVVARMTEASKLNGQEYWDLRRALELLGLKLVDHPSGFLKSPLRWHCDGWIPILGVGSGTQAAQSIAKHLDEEVPFSRQEIRGGHAGS